MRSCGLGGGIKALFYGLGEGDGLGGCGDVLAAARREAAARSEAAARELGAVAIVGARFDTAEVGHDMGEIVAYGTAVIVEQGI